MDDFSFPTIADGDDDDPDSLCRLPFPHFAASPLWFMHHHRRSLSSDAEAISKIADGDDVGGDALKGGPDMASPPPNDNDDGGDQFIDEDRMDMLWEDFNEELYRVSCNRKREAKEGERGEAGTEASDTDKHGDAAELCCVKALGVSRSGGLLHHRRLSLVTMLKLLKKLFLIQKTNSSRPSVQMGMGRSKS